MIYFVYLLFLIVMLTIERNYTRFRPIIRTIIPVVYVLFIGLRAQTVGVDTYTYYDHYYTYGQFGCDFVERGFDWLNQIMYAQGYSANDFFIVNAAITFIFIYLALNRLGKKYTYSALCFYLLTFTFLVNGMRQGVACGMFIYACKFIEEKKPLYYIIILSLASLFHASALMLMPLYFIGKRHLSENLYVGIYIFSFIGLFVNLSLYIPSIEILGRDYGHHVENMNISDASYLGFTVSTILNVLVLMLMFKNKIHERYSLLFNLVFISFVLKNLGFSIPIIGRVTIYFTWIVYFIYPIILGKDCKPLFKSMDISRIAIISLMAAIWFHGLFSSANMLMPYKFYWE